MADDNQICREHAREIAESCKMGLQTHLFLRLDARTFQNVVSAPAWAPRPTAPALLKTRSPWPASMLLNRVPYGAALRTYMLETNRWVDGGARCLVPTRTVSARWRRASEVYAARSFNVADF